jgi:uncharacterized OsmC-like protein
MKSNSIVSKRQEPLMDTYVKNPKAAWITDVAVIDGEKLDDPFHTSVTINEELKMPFPIGVHRAVGGLHDFPNPGDMLCASLASCFESTLRMIANRLQIVLEKTKVKATANVDVRGTLMIDRGVPVGFQSMNLEIEIRVANSTQKELIYKLLKGTERCCIVYQTLKQGTPININTKVLNADNEIMT